jgi:hypothetical protein
LKKILITTLRSLGFFLTGIILALLFEADYRRLIRFLFTFFNGDRIQFSGKDFHLLPGVGFILSFGTLAAIMYISLKHLSLTGWLKQVLIIIGIFFLFTALVSYVNSKILIIECTACKDGIKNLRRGDIKYDLYFICSNIVCVIYLLTRYLLHRRSLKKKLS